LTISPSENKNSISVLFDAFSEAVGVGDFFLRMENNSLGI